MATAAADAKSLTSRPAWKALEAHSRDDPRPAPAAACSPTTPGAASGSRSRPSGRLPGLLEEPRHRRDAAAARCNSPRSPACASASTRCSAARRSTSPRTAPCCTSRCARRRARRSSSTARTSCPQVHAVLDKMAAFCRPRAQRRRGRATPASGSATSSTSASAARTSGPVMAYEALKHYSDRDHDVPVRLQRRRHRLRRGDPRPRPGGDAVHRLVEDVHDAGDDDQRPHAPATGRWRRWAATQGGRQALRRRLDQRRRSREVRHRHGEHVRVLGLGRRPLLDGFGDRPVDHARHRPRQLPRDARRLPRRWTSTSAPRRSSRTCPC